MIRVLGRAASRAVVLNAMPTGRRDLSIEPTMETNIDPKLDLYKVFQPCEPMCSTTGKHNAKT